MTSETGKPSASDLSTLATLRALIDRASAPTDVTPLARMESLIALDFACEAVTRMALRRRRMQAQRNEYLPTLLKKLDEEASGALAHTDSIRELHEARDAALHGLRGPDETYIEDVAPAVRGFVASVVHFSWGVDFEAISLSNVIEDPKLREMMRKAESALATDDLRQALIALAAARSELQLRLPYHRPEAWRGNWANRLPQDIDETVGALIRGLTRGVGSSEARDLERDFQQLGAELDSAFAEIDALGIGLTPKEFRWFRSLVPFAVVTVGGATTVFLPKEMPSVMQVRRAFGFLLRWIEASGNLPTDWRTGRDQVEEARDEVAVLPPDWLEPPDKSEG